MLDIPTTLKILNSYNINSHKYGPTVYENASGIGICLDIKDPTFSFLTRGFIFQTENELHDFLKKNIWYKKNEETYDVKLSLSDYDSKEPNIKYIHQNKDLSLDEMLNLKEIIETNETKIIETDTKSNYLANIKELTNYIINLKKIKENTKSEKNNLKIKENDLKFELLTELTNYYGKSKNILKKAVSLDNIIPNNNEINLLETNAQNIETKSLEEIKNYLTSLLEVSKQEELDDKHLVNLYSNSIYKYNIEILNKQIEFVKNKIASERNFNLKGSKIHNIDEELKSFLKSANAPMKIDIFLSENKNRIKSKYNAITDIKNAYTIISGNKLNFKETKIAKSISKNKVIKSLYSNYNSLPKENKASLILYNSFYKNICNYIINNNYPEINDIKNKFDFEYYYKEIEEIVYNENNSHYLINYFYILDFKNIDSYINSIINICKVVENTYFINNSDIKAFYLPETNKYKTLTINPIFNKDTTIYLVDILANSNVLYIPEKIEYDEDNKEFNTITSNNIYIKEEIIDTTDTLTVNIYNKINEKYNNSDIIITKDLKLNKSIIFHIGTLERGIKNG
ncbi:MAG: hypothetical protein HFI36_07320 [Bacilli bacterium]|jgi:hypothetical protein|nr:hypothetical protein [Bacilli bacterium]